MNVVIVDTRGMSPSQIDGYEETTITEQFFNDHVLGHRNLRCIKSKVAKLCGLNMRIYFHEFCRDYHHSLNETPKKAVVHERFDLHPFTRVNGAATLLTFDPRTGYPEYKITGKAYAVVNCGDYPLSNHEVWGVQELISEARDFYYCDPSHAEAGQKNLVNWCKDYRNKNWGPLTIYEPRYETKEGSGIFEEKTRFCLFPAKVTRSRPQISAEEQHEYYNHRHFPGCPCKSCQRS